MATLIGLKIGIYCRDEECTGADTKRETHLGSCQTSTFSNVYDAALWERAAQFQARWQHIRLM